MHSFHDEDEDHRTPPSSARWRENFPYPAGRGLRRELTMFETLHNAQVTRGESIWGKFSDEGDWNVARWILVTACGDTSLRTRCRSCLQAWYGREVRCNQTLTAILWFNGLSGNTEIRVPRTRRLNLESFGNSKTTFLYYSPLLEPDVIPKTPVCLRQTETALLWAFLLMM